MGDPLIGTLAALDLLDPVRLTVAGETIPVYAEEKRHEDGRICVTATERDGRRTFRIETQWAAGWLDPLVDVCVGEEFRALGTLDDVERVDGSESRPV